MQDLRFDDEDELNQWLENFFDSKPEQFYRDGIMKLPGKWQVIDNDSDYFLILSLILR